MTLPSGAITTMAYRADALRFSKQDSSGTAKFLWDDQKLLSESDATNTTQASYTLLPDQFGQLLSQRRSGVSSFYHHSGIGSEAGLTDNGANVTDTYVYEGFGAMVAQSGVTVNPFRFIGRVGYYFDSPLGQYYIRARYYSSILARWLSEDPIGYDSGDSNLYRYAGADPILLADPLGLVYHGITGQCNITIYLGHAVWNYGLYTKTDPWVKAFLRQYDTSNDTIVTECGHYVSIIGCNGGALEANLKRADPIPGLKGIMGDLKATDFWARAKAALNAAKRFQDTLCKNRKMFCDDGKPERYAGRKRG